MKKLLILFFLMITALVSGQEEKQIELGEVTVTPPKFIGVENIAAMMREQKSETINEYLARNVEYPQYSKHWNHEGVVVVQFIVTKTGDISDINIVNPISYELDNEVVRALKKTNGMWLPGSNNDQPTDMKKEACVCFKMDYSSENGVTVAHDFDRLAKAYFIKGAKKLFEKNRPKAALRAFDMAMVYRPLDHALLLNRSYCRFALGDLEGARKDWGRIKELGGKDATIASLFEDQFMDYELDPMFFQLVAK